MEIIAFVHRRQNLTQVFSSTVFNHVVDITPSSPSVVLDQQQDKRFYTYVSLLRSDSKKRGSLVISPVEKISCIFFCNSNEKKLSCYILMPL